MSITTRVSLSGVNPEFPEHILLPCDEAERLIARIVKYEPEPASALARLLLLIERGITTGGSEATLRAVETIDLFVELAYLHT